MTFSFIILQKGHHFIFKSRQWLQRRHIQHRICRPMRTENILDWPIREPWHSWHCWPMRTKNILAWPIRELLDDDQWERRTFCTDQSEHFQTLDLPTNDFPFLYNKYLIPGPENLIESLASRIPEFFLSNLVLPSDWLVSWSFIKLRLVSFDHTCGEKYISLFWYAFWNSMISQVSQRTSDQ